MPSTKKTEKSQNKKTTSRLHLLPKGSCFRTSIRFTLLHPDELGLLLAALTWPKYQTVGMGKPYGAGCVQFKQFQLNMDRITYDLTHFFAPSSENYVGERFEAESQKYILRFLQEMEEIHPDIKQSEPVQAYLAMRKGVYSFNKEYMPLTPSEETCETRGGATYSAKLPLPTVSQLLQLDKDRD